MKGILQPRKRSKTFSANTGHVTARARRSQKTRRNDRHPQTKSPPKRRAFVGLHSLGEKLERAKGLEPSTPTLARSCSTTELHPHPLTAAIARQQRRSYAKCGL